MRKLVKQIWNTKGLARWIFLVGLIITILFVVAAIFAPWIAPFDYNQTRDAAGVKFPKLAPPGGDHWLGTNDQFYDIWSRVVWGARTAVEVVVLSVVFSALIGVPLGMVSGFVGGSIDRILVFLMDALYAFPSLLLAIGFIAVLGANVATLLGVLALRSWAVHARTVRGSVLLVREQESVLAARALGAGPLRLAFREVLPNVLAPLVVVATAQLGAPILLESTLSFLGLGIQPPRPSWGNMLSAGRPYITVAWWVTAMPGFAILAAVLGANLLGDGLRDALDPRLKI